MADKLIELGKEPVKSAKKPEKKHDHYGHRQRLKNRFLNEGLENFEDHNILELLLFFSIPQCDTNEIAHRLLNYFGGLAAVFDASVEELIKVKGISQNSATLITMLKQVYAAYERDKAKLADLSGKEEIETYIFNKLKNQRDEKVMVVCLDNRFRRLGDSIISDGTINFAGVDRRKLAELVLRYNSNGIIIAHNHPGGFAVPSSEDIDTTIELKRFLAGIGVELVDHVIVSQDDYMSLASSMRFAPIFGQSFI